MGTKGRGVCAEAEREMDDLQGRIALVTGASQGIGRACALELARAGATVALAARNEAKLAEVVAEIEAAGGQAAAFALDVASEESIKAGAKAVLERFGKVEILVNNAGITRDGLMMAMKRADWDDVLAHQPDGGVSADPGAAAAHAQEPLGPDHQYFERGGPHRAGGPGELCGLKGRADRADAVDGARGGLAGNHRECRGAGLH